MSSKGADFVVKIGDFDLAKELYRQEYYQVREIIAVWGGHTLSHGHSSYHLYCFC